jgi:hypothetical protein
MSEFDRYFPAHEIGRITAYLEEPFIRSFFDPCFDVPGMMSVKKQILLKIAYSFIDEGEAYLEVGTYVGKSLVSAMAGNELRPTYGCDNFSEFKESSSLSQLRLNLENHALLEKVHILDDDFRNIVDRYHVPEPVGLYFYDGAHDHRSQYEGIKLVEHLLADRALVIVDDWRLAPDSNSYAKAGTEQAIAESPRQWTHLYDLPARLNGDHATWWNGIAVFATSLR